MQAIVHNQLIKHDFLNPYSKESSERMVRPKRGTIKIARKEKVQGKLPMKESSILSTRSDSMARLNVKRAMGSLSPLALNYFLAYFKYCIFGSFIIVPQCLFFISDMSK